MGSEGKILVTGSSIDEQHLDVLRSKGYTVVNPSESFPPLVLSEEHLSQSLQDCVGYIVGGDEWASETAMAAAPNLKVVAFLGVGYQSFIDAQAAAGLNIPVTNTPGTYANSVAEFTIGMLLDRRRRIFDYAASFKADSDLEQEKRYDLFGHDVGIVGMGHIGARLVEILVAGFGADVSYYNRSRKSALEERYGIRYMPLNELVSSVESLIVMLPEDSSTTGLISAEVLESRPTELPGLHIINTSRPEINDPTALVAALKSGRVESVAFDGFYRDKTPESELLKSDPRVLTTPHIASLTFDAREAMSQMCIESVIRVLSGKRDENTVNM